MVKYRLIYLDTLGRCEVTRMLFFLGGQEFEDHRFPLSDMEKQKPGAPFKLFPVLEVDGVKMCQSHSIDRFLANKYGYAGRTPMDKFRADMIVDCTEDIIQAFAPAVFGENGFELKVEMLEYFEKVKLPEMLADLEALLIQSKRGDGYFVGDDITYADMSVRNVVNYLRGWELDLPLEKTQKLQAFLDRVENHPKMVAWKQVAEVGPNVLDVVRSMANDDDGINS